MQVMDAGKDRKVSGSCHRLSAIAAELAEIASGLCATCRGLRWGRGQRSRWLVKQCQTREQGRLNTVMGHDSMVLLVSNRTDVSKGWPSATIDLAQDGSV